MNTEQYEAVATVLRHTRDFHDVVSRGTISEQLADVFAKSDSRFNRDKFLADCGMDEK